jgi:multicomponent Na+:H+ antiporter subunit G
MTVLLELASWMLLTVGGALAVIGGVGVLRFPDFYTRLHAASITDTLCSGLILAGLALQAGLSLVSAKLVLIFLFLMLTSPAAAYAIAKAARHGGLQPIEDRREEGK